MKKRWLSLLLSITMLLSLVTVPTQAALVDGTATLTVTPNVTAVKAGSDAVEITYTITLTPPSAEKTVGPFQFTLVAPEGMTLSETKLKSSEKGGNGYWVNTKELKYNEDEETGTFNTVSYAPLTKTFAAAQVVGEKISSSVDVMTIRATIAAGKVGDFELDVTNCVIGVDGEDYYTVNVSTTPVSVYSELDGAAVTGLTAPAKGGAPDGEVSSSDHTSATVAWFLGENAVTGNFAANTQYTAKITVTPDAGYRFADGASFTVDGASDWAVADGQNGAKVLTKTFPATAAKTLESITVTTAPTKTAYEVGDNFDATGMVVSAHYDEGADDTDYSKYTVLGGANLQLGTASVTIASTENNSITTTQAITVSRKNLTGDDFEYTNGTATYDGNDHASTARNIQGFQEGLMGSLSFIFKVGDNVVQELINAGVYTVYVSTEEGSKYNAMGRTEVGTFTISQADNSISNLTIDGWTYGDKTNAPSASATFGTVAYTYSNAENGTFTSDVPTDAGTWYVKATVAETTNYKGAEAVTSFIIAPKAVTVTADNASKVYNAADPTLSATVTGLLGSDTITYTLSRAAGDNVGTYTITPAGDATQGNYNVSYVTGTFTISQADNSISNLTMENWTYGENAKAPSATAAFGTVAYTYSNAENGTFTSDVPTDAGTWYVKATVAETTNYKGASEVTSFVIAPKTVDVSALTWDYTQALTYNGAEQTVTLAGQLPEGVTANYQNNAKQYVGQYEASVTFSPVSNNYLVNGSVDSLNWSIVAAAQNPTVEASRSLAKGGNTLDLTTLVSGNQGDLSFEIVSGGEYATLSGTTLTSGTTTGSVVITVKAAAKNDGGDSKVEYSAYVGESAITVTVVDKEQKELTVTMGDWTYGDNAKSPAFTAPAGSAAPAITYTGKNYSSNEVPTDAGTYTVQVVCETATEIYTGSDEFTINPKTASITWSNTSFTYDGQNHVPTATVSNKVGQDSVSVTVSGAATAAGSYTATATGLDNANYVLPAVAPTRSFTIAKRTAELNWSNTSFTYDGQSHQPTATVTNAVDGDTVTVTVSGGKTNAGSYTATAAELSNSNYALPTAKTQSFTIVKRTAELNWTNTSFTYDGKSHVPTATVTNAVEGDTVTVTVTGGQTNAGNYTATATKVSNSNYALPDTTGCDFTIAPKNISDMTVNLSAAALTYNGKAQTKAVASVRDGSTTLSSGRDYTVSGATQTNAGHYELTVTGTGNYTGSKTVAWEIAPKAVTITANNASKVYGEADPTLTATVSGVVSGDTIVATASRADGNNVGSYTISAAVDTNSSQYTVGNYNISLVNATFTINPKAVTVKANDAEKTYGEKDPQLTATVTGLLGEDSITYDVTRKEGDNAGTYTITASGAATQGNYTVTYVAGKFTVKPLTGEEVVAGEGVSQMEDSQIQEFREALALTDEAVGIQEGDSEKTKQEKRENAVKDAMVSTAKLSNAGTSGLYFVNANSAAVPQIVLAVPNGTANSGRFNYKVIYMAANGAVTEVPSQVTVNGIVADLTDLPEDASGVYMVAYTPKPVHVVDDSASASGSQSIITDLTGINRVTVDGKTVDSKYYTVSGGVVTLSEAYLRTLSNGKHTVRVENAKYVSTAVITVSNSTVKSAGTGDAGLGLYAMLALSSVTGAAWLGLKKRKED